MAEEETTTQTEESAQEQETQTQEKQNVDDLTREGPEPKDFPPLFDDEPEGYTEAQLTGEDEEEEASGEEDNSETPPPSDDQTKSEDPKGDEKEDDETKEEKEEEEGDAVKPPPGYVPLAALHEERGKRQLLSQEIDALKSEVQTLKQLPLGEEKKTEEEFKVLTDEEFAELLEDDPTEAILYDRKLRAYEAKQAAEAQRQAQEQVIIDRSVKAMTEVIPDIYDPQSSTNAELSKFALEQGFDEAFLPVLTDPRTKVIPPGQTDPVLLGEAAVGQVKLLYSLYQQRNNDNRNALEAEIEAKLTPVITERVTKELMSKIKTSDNNPPGFTSLGEAPGAGDEPFDITKNLTAEQVDKLSPAKRRAYLGG